MLGYELVTNVLPRDENHQNRHLDSPAQFPDTISPIPIVQRLRDMQQQDLLSLPESEQWEYLLGQMPYDLGGSSIKQKLREVCSQRYNGKILEAMCGYNSFFVPRDGIEVIATDSSQRGLELYDYPERTRIRFDLDTLSSSGDHLPFAQESEFDVISICYGYRYLRNIVPVLEAFKSALKPDGKMVFVEASTAGYKHLVQRDFTPKSCEAHLKQAGFDKITSELLIPTGKFPYTTNHFLVEAAQ